MTITLQPALAPSPQPRPAPTARALPPKPVAQRGQNWAPIDTFRSRHRRRIGSMRGSFYGLLQCRLDASKGGVQARAKALHNSNDNHRYAGRDETILDGGCSRVILQEAKNELAHQILHTFCDACCLRTTWTVLHCTRYLSPYRSDRFLICACLKKLIAGRYVCC
jgi:hypothetical protein